MPINARRTVPPLLSLTLLISAGVLTLSPSVFAQQTYTFTQIDAPKSTFTEGRAINDNGEVVGDFTTVTNKGVQTTSGFVYGVKGKLTPFTAPRGSNTTQATGVNNTGRVVGSYMDSANVWHGFIYENRIFTTLDPSGSTLTFVWGVNGNGDVVGSFTDQQTPSGHGFLYTPPAIVSLDDPLTGVYGFTTAFAVNNLADVAGDYGDGTMLHGFTKISGTYSTFDPTGSTETHALGINGSDQVAGFYIDSSKVTHAFLCGPGSGCTTLDPPASVFTVASGINESGKVVGYYTAPDLSHYHGFVYDPVSNTYSTIDPPGASGSFTLANGINTSGQVVGEFSDAAGATHAFIATPNP